jgi:hypothetical protein
MNDLFVVSMPSSLKEYSAGTVRLYCHILGISSTDVRARRW